LIAESFSNKGKQSLLEKPPSKEVIYGETTIPYHLPKTLNIVFYIVLLMGKHNKRINLRITLLQSKMLEKEKERTGNSISSIIRHAISDHVRKNY